MSNALVFQSHTLSTIEHDNQLWLRIPQIGVALGYANPEKAITKIYARHSDEFTSSMTRIVEVETRGGEQKVRVFSLRGCHLVAMFAKTPVAKEFRRWILDILDAEADKMQLPAPTLTPEEQRFLQKRVSAKTKDVVHRDNAFCFIYHKLKEHFSVARYSQIPSDRFEEAVNLVDSLSLSNFEKYTGARMTEREHEIIHRINALSVELHHTIRDLTPLFDRVAEAGKLPMN